jgi:hypothetical protein
MVRWAENGSPGAVLLGFLKQEAGGPGEGVFENVKTKIKTMLEKE